MPAQTIKAEEVQLLGQKGRMGQVLTSVVFEAAGSGGKRYRPSAPTDLEAFAAAASRLSKVGDLNGLPPVPDEPVAEDPRNIWCFKYGLDTFGKLFNARQLLALTTFARLVREAHAAMLAQGLDADYAKAVATYLGLAVDRLSDRASALCRWDASPKMEAIANTFGRQALPMVWDYAEGLPFSDSSGGFPTCVGWILTFLEADQAKGSPAVVLQRNSRDRPQSLVDVLVTDPPYYDAVNYADLSDFFYVWLKRSLGDLHPDLLSLPLTPKRDQIVMNAYANGAGGGDRRAAARRHYVDGMAAAFAAMRKSLLDGGLVGVVFAHTDADAWSTLIEGLLGAVLVPDASWPIDTELENKVSRLGQARLTTSVWMACRPRQEAAGQAFLGDVMAEMRPVIRERLLSFWSKGIRGADFFISAIGPALSVFGRYDKVMRPDGTEVTVRDFLDLVRRESTTVALEQVLHGADLGVIDPLTRQYVTWVWSYSRAPLDAGEAIALCLATGADYGQVVRPHAIAAESREKSKKLVKLRTIRERGAQDEDLGMSTPARPAPLIDQLQRAAWLWGQNKPDELAKYRVELGEARWQALCTLGQAVAECLPVGDEDRRLLNGLLSSSVMSAPLPPAVPGAQQRLGI